MPKKTTYPYKLTVNMRKDQGEYLETTVKEGNFVSINHAIRSAIDNLQRLFPTEAEIEKEKDDKAKEKLGIE